MTGVWGRGCWGSLGVGVVVSIRASPSWGRFLGVLAEFERSSPSASRGLCAAERIDTVEAEGGWEHTPHARTHTHTHTHTHISREARTSLLISAPGRRYC